MKGGSKPKVTQGGFTIMETVIVLAITAGLLVMAGTVINGRQASTQFSQGIQETQSQVQQAMNDVSNGFYPNNGSITCAGSATGPVLTDTAAPEGTNRDCAFLGKLLQFGIGSDDNAYNTYTVVGLSGITDTSLDPATSLAASKPRLLARGSTEEVLPTHVPDVFETHKLPFGLSVVNMYYGGNPAANHIGAVVFLAGLQSLSASNNTQQVDVAALPGSGPSGSPSTFLTKDQMVDTAGAPGTGLRNLPAAAINPAGGVHICLKSAGTDQSALLTIGGDGNQSSLHLDVMTGGSCS